MNKKVLIIAAALAAMALSSCDSAQHKDGQATTEQTADDGAFKPTGDPQKDAQTIADMIVQSSERMMSGEVNPEEDQKRADKMIKAANDYYTSQKRGEEFQQALNTATEVAIDSLGVLLGKGKR